MSAARRRKRRAGASGLIISLLCFSLAGGLMWALGAARDAAAPSADPGAEAITDVDGFPLVDWDYWRGLNPDIVGWITIPGTSVNHPVAQAPAHAPELYLDHDATGSWNPYGCPYLDAACAEEGLLSYRPVIEGHNLADGSMFSDVAQYLDGAYASCHRVVLLQAPGIKWEYRVEAVEAADASAQTVRVGFGSASELGAWWRSARASSLIDLADELSTGPSRVLSLVTCESAGSTNGRVVVHAVLVREHA